MPYNEHDQIGGWIALDPNENVYRVYWRGNRMRPTFTSRMAALSYLCGLRSGVRIAELDDDTLAGPVTEQEANATVARML